MTGGKKLATEVRQISAARRGVMEEQVKQIVLNHFCSLYSTRNMEEALENVSEDIRWTGSEEYYVAHGREEFKSLLEKELSGLPKHCVIEVMAVDSTMINEECFSVCGELEVRMHHPQHLFYSRLRFASLVLTEEGKPMIVSLHTSLRGENFENLEGAINGNSIHHMADDMRRQNQYDILTGLYTLETYKKEVKKLLKSQPTGNYAMFCTDVAHFERVNNIYGLKIADKILCQLATMLTTFSPDVKICCRSVADHFLVLVAYEDRKQLEQKLNQLCLDFRKKVTEHYPDASPKLGIGVYELSDLKEDAQKMVEHANLVRKALRKNKSSQIIFYDAFTFAKIEKAKVIEDNMQGALEHGEFKVYIQPKYSLRTERIVGAEALCRWIHDDGTMVYPDEFIPIFEEDGFIAELDFYMLEKVCEMIKRREAAGQYCVSISINQSRVLLQDNQYVSKIASVLGKYDIPCEYIELELTERIFQDNLTEMAEMMGELKKSGIRWSIDDFGTGYSSLNLLKELPVDVIKIDKSFLDETETSEKSKIIIRKTVELTQELDKHVVCEGVETESQADYLRDISCDMAQGYLYARPMPMDEFECLLNKEIRQ
jgi:diguanylate cyclase (GGDEF)-like protein